MKVYYESRLVQYSYLPPLLYVFQHQLYDLSVVLYQIYSGKLATALRLQALIGFLIVVEMPYCKIFSKIALNFYFSQIVAIAISYGAGDQLF